ncbi:MAG TPA: carboxypeptidase-like regulatory domain-containing protein, partial [Vicinamibacterales bacterium]
MTTSHTRAIVRTLLFAALCISLPSLLYAQSIAGTVRDTSGAVLPGVSVEATSPALIEKTRSVVTDANGQFQIIDLRPGTYTVTFTLQGFSTVARQNLELSGGGVTTVNAEMRVGGIQETLTVTGDAPVVDV